MSWTTYKPFKNGEYNTIWELARQLVDEYRQEYPLDSRNDDTLIQEYGIPYLCRWVFTTDGVNPLIDLTRPEWDEFMKMFFMRFLNMEIYATDPRAWKRSISMTMLEYKEFLEDSANVFYESLKGAGATTTSTRKTDASGTQSGNTADTGKESHTAKGNSSSTGKSTHSGENSSTANTESENSASTNSTSNGTTTNDGKDTSSQTSSNRTLTSDMPQSNVSASTVGNPELETWTYASAMQDVNGKTDSTNTTASSTTHSDTSEGADSSNGKSKTTQSGTDSATDTRMDSSENASSGESTTTRTGESSSRHADTSEETATSETMSAFELTKEKYEFFREHMKKPLYSILDICYKYFISTYPDEERWGFLDWDAVDRITSKVKEANG